MNLQKTSVLNVSSGLLLVGVPAGHDRKNGEGQCPPEGVSTCSLQPRFLPMRGLRLDFLFFPCFCFIKLDKECLPSRKNVYLPGRVGLHFSKGLPALLQQNSGFCICRHNSCMPLVTPSAYAVFPTLLSSPML